MKYTASKYCLIILVTLTIFSLPVFTQSSENPVSDPQIVVSPDTLNFGYVFTCSTPGGDFFIQNAGNDPLQVLDFVTTPSWVFDPLFSVNPPFFIPPGGNIMISMTFEAYSPGYCEGDLLILSNDPIQDTAVVHLQIEVYSWQPYPTFDPIEETVIEGDSVTIFIDWLNISGGILRWNTEIEYLDGNIRPSSYSPGDTIFTFDVTSKTPSLDTEIRGVEFDGESYWIAGADPGSGVPKIYRFDKEWNYISSFSQPPGHPLGFADVAMGYSFLYGNINFTLYIYDLLNGTLISQNTLPISNLQGLALDPGNYQLWASQWTGSIYVLDPNGFIINQFPYSGPPIEGLGWDDWSPESPFLWQWVADGPPQGPNCTAVQYDPLAGQLTGVSFVGMEMNGDPAANDLPAGATVRFVDNQLTFLALQASNFQPGDGHDYLVGYSLGYERYDWLKFSPDTGAVPPCTNTQIEITLYGILGAGGDSVRTANIWIHTNDPVTPEILVPVTMTVSPLVSTQEITAYLPREIFLHQNYPNPFNQETIIKYQITSSGYLELTIYSILGQKVRTLVNSRQLAGEYLVHWDGRDNYGQEVGSGVYIYQLRVGNITRTRKMLLLR